MIERAEVHCRRAIELMKLASDASQKQHPLCNRTKRLADSLPERFLVRLQDCAGLSGKGLTSTSNLLPEELATAHTLLARIHRQSCRYTSCLSALQAALVLILSHQEVLRMCFCKALAELGLLHKAQDQLDLAAEASTVCEQKLSPLASTLH